MRGSKTNVIARVQKLIGGIDSYASSKMLLLNGVPVKATALTQQLQAKVDLLQAVDTAREAYQRAVAAAKPVAPSLNVTIAEVKAYAAATFGAGSEAYVAMGFSTSKRRPTSLATKLHAAVTRTATRAARGIIGSQKKAAIRALVPMQSISIAPTAPPVISNATSSSAPAGSTVSQPTTNGTGSGSPTR